MSVEKLDRFNELAAKLRSAKVDKDEAIELEKEIKEEMIEIANELELDKGNYNGIKLMHRYNFVLNKVNRELIKQNGIKIPQKTYLNLSSERIKELIDEGVIKQDEISQSDDLTKLKQILKEKEIYNDCEFELSYSFGYAK